VRGQNKVSSKYSMIAEIAPELGLEVHIEPEYGYVGQIKTKDGRIFYFRNTSFDLNGQSSGDNAKDKGYAAYFMKLMDYPIPEGGVCCWTRVYI